MKFASCRIVDDKFIVDSFFKEYSKTVFESSESVKIAEAAEIFRDFDYIDLVISGRDLLYFSRNYPPVKPSYLLKIIAQDIESETPFKSSEMVIDAVNFQKSTGEMNVFAVKKEIVSGILDNFDDSTKEKIRSIIPEQVLFFKTDESVRKAIFIGDDYSLLVTRGGQIVRNGGLNELYKELLSFFNGENPREELDSCLNVVRDLSVPDELSDIEVIIRKTIITFFEKSLKFFLPFAGESGKTAIFVDDSLPRGGAALVESLDSSDFSDLPFTVVEVAQALEIIPKIVDNDETANFAVGDFAYKGGFTFLKKRIFLVIALYLVSLVLLIVGMQTRISYLDGRIAAGEERTKTLMREVIGKEVPSLRQALSIMDKTIKGEAAAADKKALYPYSALYIMESVFPYFTFENSTIEVSEISIKEEGKARVVGTSSTLEDINKLSELLEQDPLISEVNRGQINTRGDKSSFNISFNFAGIKKEETKSKKAKKKGKEGK